MSESDINIDMDKSTSGADNSKSLVREVIEFCGGPDLIEVFGESGSGKSEFAKECMKSLVDETSKDALFIDTERNVGGVEEIEGADYVYIPEWNDVYHYTLGNEAAVSDDAFGTNTTNSNSIKNGYEMVVLDSIGFPALTQWAKYSVADDSNQFDIFEQIQAITGELKKYAQYNDALVLVTNQPKSALSDENDPKPFGDKSIFGFKEVWKSRTKSSTEIKTRCTMEAYRSRQAGKGKVLFELDIDDSGTDISRAEGDSDDEFMM